MKSEQAAVAVAFKSGVGVRVIVGVTDVVSVGVLVSCGGSVFIPILVSEGVAVSDDVGPVMGIRKPQSFMQANKKYPRKMDKRHKIRIMTINIRIVRFNARTSFVSSSFLPSRFSMGRSLDQSSPPMNFEYEQVHFIELNFIFRETSR
jgi:hypothetical protein